MPVGRIGQIGLVLLVAIVAASASAGDLAPARDCYPDEPDVCAMSEPLDHSLSFNSATMRAHRLAAIPPWRDPVGRFDPASPRLMRLRELASHGQRPALPNWRRDPVAKSNPSPFAEMTSSRRFDATLFPAHIPDSDRWAAVLEAVQVGEACPCPLSQADGPGRVPNGADFPGTQLTINKIPGSERIALSWGESCSSNVTNYAIHEGHIGFWYNHKERRCSTGGQTSWDLIPRNNSRYYLIVPINDVAEGSYGTDSNGDQRPPGFFTCQSVVLSEACAP